jgi:hypothetical protein
MQPLLIEVHDWGTPVGQELNRFPLQHGYTSTIQWTRGRESFDLGCMKNRHVIEAGRMS